MTTLSRSVRDKLDTQSMGKDIQRNAWLSVALILSRGSTGHREAQAQEQASIAQFGPRRQSSACPGSTHSELLCSGTHLSIYRSFLTKH